MKSKTLEARHMPGRQSLVFFLIIIEEKNWIRVLMWQLVFSEMLLQKPMRK